MLAILIKKIERSDTTSFHFSLFNIQFGSGFGRLGYASSWVKK
jgi:hypothetical protein